MPSLGPGTLTIGATGAEIDASCLLNGARIASDKTQAEATRKLCGLTRPGAVTYTATLSGNVDLDADPDGLFALTWAQPGSVHAFTFVPSTDWGVAAAGELQIDPLDFGADAFGDDLTSDFEFAVVGDVTFTYPGGGAPVVFRTGEPITQPDRPYRHVRVNGGGADSAAEPVAAVSGA